MMSKNTVLKNSFEGFYRDNLEFLSKNRILFLSCKLRYNEIGEIYV